MRGFRWVCRVRRLILSYAVLAVATGLDSAYAQQFVTDDAALVEPGACQLEAWYARPASSILPACQVFPNLEVTAGLGAVETVEGVHDVRYVLQGEYQIGLRLNVVPDRLGVDLSYSGATAGDARGAFTVGFAWTPPPWR